MFEKPQVTVIGTFPAKTLQGYAIALALILGWPGMASADLVADFEGTGLLEGSVITTEIDGLTISGGKLVREGSPGHGFGSFAACFANDTVCTGACFDHDFLAPTTSGMSHFISIDFDSPVSHLAFTLGDIDANERLEITAYDSDGLLLEDFIVQSSGPDTGDGHGTCVQFTAPDIARIEINHLTPALYGVDNITLRVGCECAVTVPVDIKPQSCPNPLNVGSRSNLPVAILGTPDFDVTTVDPASIRLEGVAPLRSSLEDVATPFDPFEGKEDCDLDCTEEGADGFIDLTLKFNTQEIVDALGDVEDGECRVLQLTGELVDGTPIAGEDVVVIREKIYTNP